jgi:hypothetical protein
LENLMSTHRWQLASCRQEIESDEVSDRRDVGRGRDGADQVTLLAGARSAAAALVAPGVTGAAAAQGPRISVWKTGFFVANTFQIQPFHRDWRSRQMWLLVW